MNYEKDCVKNALYPHFRSHIVLYLSIQPNILILLTVYIEMLTEFKETEFFGLNVN